MRVSGQWEKRKPNADVYVCTARTWGTAPQPMPVWWRVVVDCTDPEPRHSLSRRCTGKRVIVRSLPSAHHKWCVAPWHTTMADNLHTLDVLHGNREAWMTRDHPHLQAPTRRVGEYGQWLVDMQHWRLHTQINEDQHTITRMQEHAVMVVNPEVPSVADYTVAVLPVKPHRSWMARYNAWMVWVQANLIANADATAHGFVEALRRICSTPRAQCVLPPSIVWDIHQATCLLPIHLNPTPHNDQWTQLQRTLWASFRDGGDAPECIVCTAVLARCPLVVTECGHMVGACCMPRMIERGVVPPGYRCPECRRTVTLGQTAWLVHANPTTCSDRKIRTLGSTVRAKRQRVVLVITHYEESMGSIVDMLRDVMACTVTHGKHHPAFKYNRPYMHVAQPLDIRALDLTVFDGAYVFDEGLNFKWLIDTLHRNGMPSGKICVLRYTDTIEDTSPPFQPDACLIEPLRHGDL